MPYYGIYVDDDPEAKILLRRLENDELKIELMEPRDLIEMADKIISKNPAIILLDYRLDELAGNRQEAAAYRAAPLAQQIRDRLGNDSTSDFPIVLVSSEHKIRTLFRPEKTAHDLFDWKLIKDDVANLNNSESSKILLGLVKGYQTLEAHKGNFDAPEILGISKEKSYLIDYQELTESLKDAEYPHIAARYILSFVIRRPGLLLDRNNLLARLGITSPEELPLECLDRWLISSRYTGVFSECNERWWSGLVEEQFEQLLGGPIDRFTAERRANIISNALKQSYKPAVDLWSKTSEFHPVFACVICHSATPLKHALSCLDGRQPNFVQRHRVCFKCIQTDKLQEFNSHPSSETKLILDESEQRVALRIRTGQLTA